MYTVDDILKRIIIAEKRVLFSKYIYPVFDKIAEVWIQKLKVFYISNDLKEVKADTVTFMLEKLGNYNQESGKAYSYFNIVAKNYLIIENRKAYNKLRTKEKLSVVDNEIDIMALNVIKENRAEKNEFLKYFIEYLDKNNEAIFIKEKDKKIVSAIIQLLRRRDYIEIFNKKALYIMIREMTGVKTQQITHLTNIIKTLYDSLYKNYSEFGKLDMNVNINRKGEILCRMY